MSKIILRSFGAFMILPISATYISEMAGRRAKRNTFVPLRYLVYMRYFDCYVLKVILMLFGTFPIFPIFDKLVSWSRLVIERHGPNLGLRGRYLLYTGYCFDCVQGQSEVIRIFFFFFFFLIFPSLKNFSDYRKFSKTAGSEMHQNLWLGVSTWSI